MKTVYNKIKKSMFNAPDSESVYDYEHVIDTELAKGNLTESEANNLYDWMHAIVFAFQNLYGDSIKDAKSSEERIKFLMKEQAMDDYNNDELPEDPKKWASKLIMYDLVNKLSRQLTFEEKELVREYTNYIYEEFIPGFEKAFLEPVEDSMIQDVLTPEQVKDLVDTENYVVGKNNIWFAKPKGGKENFRKAYVSADQGKSWYPAYVQVKNEAPSGRTQVGKINFQGKINGQSYYIGRNVLTWYANNNIHEVDYSQEIDHINGDFTDDSLKNLRRITPQENIKHRNELLKAKDSNNELFDKVLELLKGPESGYIDYLQTLADISGDYLNIEELKDLAKSDPYKIARNLIEEEIVDERYFVEDSNSTKLKFNEWLKENFNLDIITFSEKPEGYKRRLRSSYDYYLHPEDYEEAEEVEFKDSKINDIIKETKEGYIIYSEKGKRLSKPYKTKKEAEDRLKEIEMFKHMKKDSDNYKIIPNKGHYEIYRNGELVSTADNYSEAQKDLADLMQEDANKPKPTKAHWEVEFVIDDDVYTADVWAYTKIGAVKQIMNNWAGEKILAFPNIRKLEDSLSGKRFVCESHFSQKGNGLEDKFETNDIEKGKEWIWAKSQLGYYTRVIDKNTGEVWQFEQIEDPFDLEKIEPYNGDEELEDLDLDFESPAELHLWIVEWYNKNGYKFQGEFDSQEDAEEFMKEISDENHFEVKMREENRFISDSMKTLNKEEISHKLKKILGDYLIKEGFEEDDVNEWVNVHFRNFTNEYGDKGVEIELANEFVDYYDLPDEITKALDAVVAPAYFEPYSATFWQAYLFDVRIDDSCNEDSTDSNKIMDLVAKCQDILKREIIKEGYRTPEDAEITLSHQKAGQYDQIVLNGNVKWQGSDTEEAILDDLDKEIREAYPESYFTGHKNSAGGFWTLKE